jgi:hypothetical protein
MNFVKKSLSQGLVAKLETVTPGIDYLLKSRRVLPLLVDAVLDNTGKDFELRTIRVNMLESHLKHDQFLFLLLRASAETIVITV